MELHMMKRVALGLAACAAAALMLGCCHGAQRRQGMTIGLTVGAPVRYASASGERFEARYCSLTDGSLRFVKVKMPDGKEVTLPQAVSASGVRYTDERELVWWEHQGTVRVDVRDAQGNWVTKYDGLRGSAD